MSQRRACMTYYLFVERFKQASQQLEIHVWTISHTHSYQIYQSTLYCWLSPGVWQRNVFLDRQRIVIDGELHRNNIVTDGEQLFLSYEIACTHHSVKMFPILFIRWCMQSTYSCGSISAEKTRYHWSAVGEVFLCTFVGGWPLVSQIPSWDPWQDWHERQKPRYHWSQWSAGWGWSLPVYICGWVATCVSAETLGKTGRSGKRQDMQSAGGGVVGVVGHFWVGACCLLLS